MADERFQFTGAPINTNWAPSDQYRQVGLWLKHHLDESTSVAVPGEIGTVAYYSDRVLVNDFSDMSIVDALLEEKGFGQAPLVGPLIRLNFLWRRNHEPLPRPLLKLGYGPATGLAGCPVDDTTCVAAWDGSTKWVRKKRIFLKFAE